MGTSKPSTNASLTATGEDPSIAPTPRAQEGLTQSCWPFYGMLPYRGWHHSPMWRLAHKRRCELIEIVHCTDYAKWNEAGRRKEESDSDMVD